MTHARAFTLLELVVVLGLHALWAMLLTPALSRSQAHNRSVQCQNNLRQLGAAWIMYAGDHSDRVVNNFGIGEILEGIADGTLQTWANNVLDWTVNSGNTNIFLLEKGVFAGYIGCQAQLYRCPSDTYLSPA